MTRFILSSLATLQPDQRIGFNVIGIGLAAFLVKAISVRIFRGRNEYRHWMAGITRLLALWGMWLVGAGAAVACIYLGHYTGQLLGLPRSKYATIIGLFVNLIPIGIPAFFLLSLLGRIDARAKQILES